MRLKAFIQKAPVILPAVLIGILMATHASAAIYYVSTSGNNQTGDGSLNSSWASLSFACSRVSGFGDTIHVNAGSYTDNTQCVLARGVKIVGDSPSTVTINTTSNPYILANSNVPTVDGSNEISGIAFSGSNIAITSVGRNNQKIHDNTFTNFSLWLSIAGKFPTYNGNCTGSEGTATYCDNNHTLTNPPASTDWATGIEIYNNAVTNSQLKPNTIKGALIHDNTIDNSGADKCAVGATTYFWSGVDFYNNTIHMHSNARSVIAMEVWEIDDNSKFHNNVIEGWVSLLLNSHGISTPYSYQVYDNDFSSNVIRGDVDIALEVSWFLPNVRIAGNYFANTGSNNTYSEGIYIGGGGPTHDITISNNVFYNLTSVAVEINSTHAVNVANIDNIYFYNNVVDGMPSAVMLSNDGTSGDLDGVFVRNNVFLNLSGYGVTFYPWPPVTMSGNYYDHNLISNVSGGHVNTGHDNGSFTVGAGNLSATPGIAGTGNRWKAYYVPTPAGNLIDAGVNVGLPFTGTAPDIGSYEYAVLAPPTGLTVTAP